MSRKHILPLALAAAVLFAGGCGKDSESTTEPGGNTTLTTTEATSLSNALNAMGLLTFSGDPLSAPLTASRTSSGLAAQSGQTVTYNQSRACPGGGTVALAGTYTITGTSNPIGYSLTITETPTNCAGSGGDSRVWTVNGNPNLTLTGDWTINSSTSAISGTYHQTGSLSFSSNGKAGNCSVDIHMTYNYTASPQHISGSYSGTVCGQTIQTITYSY